MLSKRFTAILITIAVLLAIPFVAMQFTNEVAWSVSDFIFAAGLLLGTGILCEIVLRNVQKQSLRIALCGGILTALVLGWIQLAVGIF